jgi:protein KRI1
MPTRFKYTPTEAQTYSLTPAEILMATDQELNQYMSVKKYAPYRQGQSKWDKGRGDRLKELKQKVGERMGKRGSGGGGGGTGANAEAIGGGEKKRRKGKKERMKAKEGDLEKATVDLAEGFNGHAEPAAKKRKREDDGGDVALQEDGYVGTKKKRRHRKAAVEHE